MSSKSAASPSSQHGWLVFLFGSLFAFPFILALALDHAMSHDEHQHVAAGVLFARYGLLPYRDFPYFHLPYLVYTYGFLFQFTGHYLIATRIFAALCGSLTCGIVACVTWRFFAARPVWQRLAAAIGAMVILMSQALFTQAVGRSWNQEPSVLLALCSFLCLYFAWQRPRHALRIFASGLLLGLAIGMRVTFAPLVLPFSIMIWLEGGTVAERIKKILLFGLAIGLALLPVVWAFAEAPAGFLFGNVEFPKINLTYRLLNGDVEAMTIFTKLRFFFKEVVVPNWMVFFGFPAAGLLLFLNGGRSLSAWPRFFWFLLLVIPFLLFGALAPSPAYDQYFYPLAPFLALGIASLLASLPASPRLRWAWGLVIALVLVAPLLTGEAYENANFSIGRKWRPAWRLSDAAELRQLVSGGRVLTLAPTLPLEAGLDIYPEFSSGPFAWRIAALVPPGRRAGLHLISHEELKARLRTDPPAAIITGMEKEGEEPLLEYARENGYQPFPFQKDHHLWLAPSTK